LGDLFCLSFFIPQNTFEGYQILDIRHWDIRDLLEMLLVVEVCSNALPLPPLLPLSLLLLLSPTHLSPSNDGGGEFYLKHLVIIFF
jgi:hypothetical protein